MRRKRRQRDEASELASEEEEKGATLLCLLFLLWCHSASTSTSEEEEEASEAEQIRSIDLETLAKMTILNPKAICNAVNHYFFVILLTVSIAAILSILSPTTTAPKVDDHIVVVGAYVFVCTLAKARELEVGTPLRQAHLQPLPPPRRPSPLEFVALLDEATIQGF